MDDPFPVGGILEHQPLGRKLNSLTWQAKASTRIVSEKTRSILRQVF